MSDTSDKIVIATAKDGGADNRLVSLLLDQAELRVTNGKPLTLDFWRGNVESLIRFSEFPVLEGSGSISHERAEAIVEERYDRFDEARRASEAKAADADDIRDLEDAEKQIAKRKDKK